MSDPTLFDPIVDESTSRRDHQFHTVIKPTLRGRQLQVFNAVKVLGFANQLQVKEYLGIDLHKISGRFGELVEKGALEILDKTEYSYLYSKNGNDNFIYKAKEGNCFE